MSKREGFKKRNMLDTATGRGNTVRDVDSLIYQSIRQASAGYDSVEPIHIFAIIPDWSQPRRALPSPVRALWDGNTKSLGNLYRQWVELVHQERGNTDFDLGALLDAQDEARPEDYDTGPLESALLYLAELAGSIKRDGLTNPITVVPHQDRYLLETGERRFLAYHLLYAWYEDERWSNIPAREMQERNVWRQAAENLSRRDLNAIGMARQFAMLLMDLLAAEDENIDFTTFEQLLAAGQHEKAFYAQVADGEEFRIPKGKGELLLSALGLKNSVQLRQYRALLRLPDYLWVTADDLNWSETFIRQLVEAAKGDEDVLALLVQREAIQAGYSSSLTPPIPEENSPRSKKARETLSHLTVSDIGAIPLKALQHLERFVVGIDRVKDDEWEALQDQDRHALLDKLNGIEKRLRKLRQRLE